MEDHSFTCHHEAILDIAAAGMFLSVVGMVGVFAGTVSIMAHDAPDDLPRFGITMVVMGLLVAIPSFACMLVRQWAWIDVAHMHVVQSRRCLGLRWIDRSLPLDGSGAFLVKLFNELAEQEDRYFGCYYKYGFNEIVMYEAYTEAEAKERAALLRERFPHRDAPSLVSNEVG